MTTDRHERWLAILRQVAGGGDPAVLGNLGGVFASTTQMAVYAGFPAAVNALAAARDQLASAGPESKS